MEIPEVLISSVITLLFSIIVGFMQWLTKEIKKLSSELVELKSALEILKNKWEAEIKLITTSLERIDQRVRQLEQQEQAWRKFLKPPDDELLN